MTTAKAPKPTVIPPTRLAVANSQPAKPMPSFLRVRLAIAEAIVKATWEIPAERIRQMTGMPDLTDELIAHRVDQHMKHVAPHLYVDGARKPEPTMSDRIWPWAVDLAKRDPSATTPTPTGC